MLEHKERVLLDLSFEIEEEYLVLENQFENYFGSTQLKYYVSKESIYELSKTVECLED